MMKSTPTPAFIVAQPQLLLKFFVIPFDDPAVLGIFAKNFSEVFSGKVDNQYLVGSDSFFGHSIKSHSSGYGSVRL